LAMPPGYWRSAASGQTVGSAPGRRPGSSCASTAAGAQAGARDQPRGADPLPGGASIGAARDAGEPLPSVA
jgi:hypothetical protein